jgi:putative folate metabolism gamma-glutamate ligase
MIIKTYKTKKVVAGDTLLPILDASLPKLEENSVVVVTSKIVAICQDRIVKQDGTLTKEDLIPQEAERYIDFKYANWGYHIAIKYDQLVASAGIDESNANGYFILWPEKLEESVNKIWQYLRKKHQIRNLGVILSDSRLTPMRWGATGTGIAHCGFAALNDFRNKPDLFGRLLKVTQIAVKDGLAAAAVLQMGESNEQTPLAVITDIPFVEFQDRPPTHEELEALKITLDGDVYGPLLVSDKWRKGEGK